jgi:glycerophosphoryl diester phosphodiesterase
MRVHCHRGCPDPHPENSLAAVREVPTQVDAIEIDVQQCASGEPVVVHDRTLDRTTGRRGAVAGTQLETLEATRLEGTDTTVPTLDSVIDAVPPEIDLTVELKHAGQFDAVAPMLREAGNEVRVSSFVPQALTPFASAGVATALLVDPTRGGGWDAALAAAASIGATAVHVHYESIDADQVTTAHDRGLAVAAWTVPTEEQVARCRRAGVDDVIVDDWEIVPGVDP